MPATFETTGSLGLPTNYPLRYDPNILCAISRSINREKLAWNKNKSPVTGFDIWHAYEVGFLLNSGMPVVGILKLVCPSSSDMMIESKSFKLYLNSFNMERLARVKSDAIANLIKTVKEDIELRIDSKIEINFYEYESEKICCFSEYQIIDEMDIGDNEEFNYLSENPKLLKLSNDGEQRLASRLLRSRCKVTGQPDWGDIYIYLKGNRGLDPASFLKYIVSIREDKHFHEELCELIYTRICNFIQPDHLAVTCVFTRRGGIDITPVRATSIDLIPLALISANILTQKTFRQ